MRRPFSRPGFVFVSLLLVWTATAIAVASWWPIHRSSGLVMMAIGATLAATAVAIVGARFRWSSAVLIPVAAVVFVAIGVPLAVPTRASGVLPTPEGLVDLLRGVVFGWKQLLTITLPVGEHQSLLVPAYISVFVSVLIAVSVALRARLGELALIAPVVAMVVGLALGLETAWHPRELALAMLCLVLVWIVWRSRYRRRDEERPTPKRPTLVPVGTSSESTDVDDRRRIGLRTAAAALVTIAIAAAAGTAAATVVPPAADRIVARTVVEQPFDPRAEVSPLTGFRRYLLAEHRDVALFTVTGLPEGERLRLAALDDWNGEVYGFSAPDVGDGTGVFTRVPYRIDRDAVTGRSARIEVEIDDYSGFWLPTVGALIEVRFDGATGDDFVYDAASGTGAVISGVQYLEGYRLEAVLPDAPSALQLPRVTPGEITLPETATAPDSLLAWLDEAVGVIDRPGARLTAAIDRLRNEGYISHGLEGEPPSRAGHSYDRIAQLFTDRPMLGDAEQYATAAAIVARSLGFPARVVMGFAPDAATTPGDPVTVTGRDVTAWIEIDTAEHGWVAIDPVPPVREVPDRLPEEPVEVARPQTVLPPPPLPDPTTDEVLPPDSVQDDPEPADALGAVLIAIAIGAAWTLLVLALLVSPLLVVLAIKARRRARRRRQRDPLRRIRGAWDEFTDALVDHGTTVPETATRREVARIAGGDRARILAAATDRAVFAPRQPLAGEADAAWTEVERLKAALDTGLSRWRRLRIRVSTRSLARYSGRRARRSGVDSRPVRSVKGST